MKIRQSVLSLFLGRMILLSKYSFEQEAQFQNSPLRQAIFLKLRNSNKTLCQECERDNLDWCWNCEKPICSKHSYPLFFVNTGFILNLCGDCRQELLKLYIKQMRVRR